MKKIIYKVWQTLKNWIQNQERRYERDYICKICKRFHNAYPEYKFKCYYDQSNKNVFILQLNSKHVTLRPALAFLDEEQRILSFALPDLLFIYDVNNVWDYNPKSDIIIYEIK